MGDQYEPNIYINFIFLFGFHPCKITLKGV